MRYARILVGFNHHISGFIDERDTLLGMAGQLGIILTPYGYIPGAYPSEIARTTGGGRPMGPFDPQYYTRGERGYYYDTPLGAWEGQAPNDFQLAQQRGILTPNQGWIATNAGMYNGPWVPPNGWTPVGPTNIRIGLGDPAQDAAAAATAAIVAELNAHHRRVFMLTAVSTAAVVLASLLGAARTARQMRQDRRQENDRGV